MQEITGNIANRYLTLTLGSESFAINIDVVREILDYTSITRIPQAPAFMLGVVNVRGTAVPVVDLAQRLGLGDVQRTINTRIVIIEVTHGGATTIMGALADSVREVLELDDSSIAPPPQMGTTGGIECLRGVGSHEGRFILILNINKVFGTDDIYDMASLLESATAEAAAPAEA